MNQHHAVVGEIKSAMDQIEEQSLDRYPPRPKLKKKDAGRSKEAKTREYKVVGDEPPQMRPKFDASVCPIQMQNTPKTDVQVRCSTKIKSNDYDNKRIITEWFCLCCFVFIENWLKCFKRLVINA